MRKPEAQARAQRSRLAACSPGEAPMYRVAMCVVISLAFAMLAAEPEPKDRAGDWPLYRRTAEQTGTTRDAIPDKLEVLWKFETKDSIEGAVAVSKGIVYVASVDEHVHAIDLATGKGKWKFKSPAIKGVD